MTRNNIKNYFVIAVLILSASVMIQNNAFATTMHPNIGTASNFAVLGSSTVTNTGNTIIVGNLGVSPGTAITGFPPGIVTAGAIHAADATAATAQNDLTTAY